MDSKRLKQALTGGIIATVVMTMLMLVAPMMGMPDMKIGNMMAGFMGIPVWAGWAMHLIIGIIWAMVYVFSEGQIHFKSGFEGNAFCHFALDADATDGDAHDGYGGIFG